MDLPGKSECCWVDRAAETRYPAYAQSGRTDVAIVGAGIVGLTVAYLLASKGVAVTVLEARKVGRQVTGRSTAKVTTQHALVYAYLIRTLGIDAARMYADANRAGVELVRRCVEDARIDCDFERRDAYAYATRPARLRAIELEAVAAQRVGLAAEVLPSAPLPFDTAGALRFRDEAQFNPVRYLQGLAAAVIARGGRIFEDSRVVDAEPGRRWRLRCGKSHLDAGKVVMATHLPIAGSISFDKTTQPRAHLAMAFRAQPGKSLDGMFIGIDAPTHSLRMGSDRGGALVVVLGPHFRTGQERDVAKRFRELEAWVRANVPAGEAAWRWVNEDYDTPDRVAYAGALSGKSEGMYVATGFNAWGISNGTAAAITIADQILGRETPWAKLYDPHRRKRMDFNKSGDSKSIVRSIGRIPPGGGGVIERGRQKIAVYRSAEGALHAVSAICTHKGCTVSFNNADRTWDCPCHGSVFSIDGCVVHGPATEPLERKELGIKRA